jgi:RNA polymerase sigma factor (sigma-70 family)
VDSQVHPDEADRSRDPMGADADDYRENLHRYLTRCLKNSEDASDLAQEAYLRYLQLPDARVLHRPDRYLFRIALNLLHEWRLRRDRSAVTFDSRLADKRSGAFADSGSDVLTQLTSAEHLQKVLDCIPANYRQVLWMNRVEGLHYREIARKTGLAPDTVLVYLGRAIACARRAAAD